MIYFKLFLTFLQIGLFSVGGGYAAIPLIQELVVDNAKWISASEFGDLLTIAEMTPGPIAVNSASFVGLRIAGIPGAVAATLGVIFPAMIIVSGFALIYAKYRKMEAAETLLFSVRPVVPALIAGAGLMILFNVLTGGSLKELQVSSLKFSSLDIPAFILFAASLLMIRKFKWNPIAVMFLSGVLYLLAHRIFPM